MTTSVALLRGINVGGNRKVLMADLRAIFLDAGLTAVETYIQSGNVVFDGDTSTSAPLVVELEHRIETAMGFHVAVVLRDGRELQVVVANNPFTDADPRELVVAFFSSDPGPSALARLEPLAVAPERLELQGKDLYLHLPYGSGRSKLAQALSSLRAPPTARNWRTVTKLRDLAAR